MFSKLFLQSSVERNEQDPEQEIDVAFLQRGHTLDLVPSIERMRMDSAFGYRGKE